jgi:Mrp family chromosome partitioning ATPase
MDFRWKKKPVSPDESHRKKLLELYLKKMDEIEVVKFNLFEGRSGNIPWSVAVMSAEAGEGKTIISSLLALSLSSQGKKVVLIDANIENPCLPALLDAQETGGFFELLQTQEMDDKLFINIQENLDLLCLGNTRSEKIPDLSCFQKVMGLLKMQGYDHVIVDSPAILTGFFPLKIARFVEGILLVIASGMVTVPVLEQAKSKIGAVPTPVMGFVLNKF